MTSRRITIAFLMIVALGGATENLNAQTPWERSGVNAKELFDTLVKKLNLANLFTPAQSDTFVALRNYLSNADLHIDERNQTAAMSFLRKAEFFIQDKIQQLKAPLSWQNLNVDSSLFSSWISRSPENFILLIQMYYCALLYESYHFYFFFQTEQHKQSIATLLQLIEFFQSSQNSPLRNLVAQTEEHSKLIRQYANLTQENLINQTIKFLTDYNIIEQNAKHEKELNHILWRKKIYYLNILAGNYVTATQQLDDLNTIYQNHISDVFFAEQNLLLRRNESALFHLHTELKSLNFQSTMHIQRFVSLFDLSRRIYQNDVTKGYEYFQGIILQCQNILDKTVISRQLKTDLENIILQTQLLLYFSKKPSKPLTNILTAEENSFLEKNLEKNNDVKFDHYSYLSFVKNLLLNERISLEQSQAILSPDKFNESAIKKFCWELYFIINDSLLNAQVKTKLSALLIYLESQQKTGEYFKLLISEKNNITEKNAVNILSDALWLPVWFEPRELERFYSVERLQSIKEKIQKRLQSVESFFALNGIFAVLSDSTLWNSLRKEYLLTSYNILSTALIFNHFKNFAVELIDKALIPQALERFRKELRQDAKTIVNITQQNQTFQFSYWNAVEKMPQQINIEIEKIETEKVELAKLNDLKKMIQQGKLYCSTMPTESLQKILALLSHNPTSLCRRATFIYSAKYFAPATSKTNSLSFLALSTEKTKPNLLTGAPSDEIDDIESIFSNKKILRLNQASQLASQFDRTELHSEITYIKGGISNQQNNEKNNLGAILLNKDKSLNNVSLNLFNLQKINGRKITIFGEQSFQESLSSHSTALLLDALTSEYIIFFDEKADESARRSFFYDLLFRVERKSIDFLEALQQAEERLKKSLANRIDELGLLIYE